MSADADRVADLARRVVAEHDPKQVPVPEFLTASYDAGLSWVHFPEGLGGLGVSRGLQTVADGILRAVADVGDDPCSLVSQDGWRCLGDRAVHGRQVRMAG